MAHFEFFRFEVPWRIRLLSVLTMMLALAAVVTRRDPDDRLAQPLAKVATMLADSLAEASSLLLDSSDTIQWEPVADLATPWGRSLRLRPHIYGLAIPGSDLVVHQIAAGSETAASHSSRDESLDTFTSPENMTGPRASRVAPRRVALRSAAKTQTPWRWADPLDEADGIALAALAKGSLARRTAARAIGDNALFFAGHSLSRVSFQAVRARSDTDPFDEGASSTGRWELWAEAEVGALTFASLFSQGLLRGVESSAEGADAKPLPAAPDRTGAANGRDLGLDDSIPIAVRLDPLDGSILEARDLRILATGEALVFDPNPVITSGANSLRDGDPVDAFRTEVGLERLEDSGRLRGEHVRVESDREPKASEPTRRYEYLAVDPRFEEAMAYYHGDRAVQHAAELGFPGLLYAPLVLRVHGSPLDNSWYSRPQHTIVFGDGGVDDAEDADIILHELGHALHDGLVPGFSDGDTRAISEGFSDFWAASLTGDPCIGDWDATSYSPPCLRRTDSDATYPISLVGRPHWDGRIWSALFWDLRNAFGARDAERLALAAFLEQDVSSTWTQAADGLVQAAVLVGLDPAPVQDALVQRGLLAREVALSLQAEEETRFSFLAARATPKGLARHVILRGDGSIRLEDDLGALQATLTTAGLGESATDLRLDLVVRVDGRVLRVVQTWMRDDFPLLAVRTDWDGRTGEIQWTYLHATAEAVGFHAGVAIDADAAPAVIDWNAQARSSASASTLRAIRGDLETPLALTGTRFGVRGDPAGFTLEMLASPIEGEGAENRLFAQPNPLSEETTLRLLRSTVSPVAIGIFDASGRLLREHRASAALGLFEWTWDGRDGRGERVVQGRYWARARIGSDVRQASLVVLR